MIIVPRSFYERSPLLVAPDLLGKILVRKFAGKILTGRIVEVEAYLAIDDAASHGAQGLKKHTQALFQGAGHVYVASVHKYHCLNIVTEGVGVPSSVLIRALEPLSGVDQMKKFRHTTEVKNLTNGPGKLSQALQINRDFNGWDVTQKNGSLFVIEGDPLSGEIITRPRIGITQAIEKNFRFYLKNNSYISHV